MHTHTHTHTYNTQQTLQQLQLHQAQAASPQQILQQQQHLLQLQQAQAQLAQNTQAMQAMQQIKKEAKDHNKPMWPTPAQDNTGGMEFKWATPGIAPGTKSPSKKKEPMPAATQPVQQQQPQQQKAPKAQLPEFFQVPQGGGLGGIGLGSLEPEGKQSFDDPTHIVSPDIHAQLPVQHQAKTLGNKQLPPAAANGTDVVQTFIEKLTMAEISIDQLQDWDQEDLREFAEMYLFTAQQADQIWKWLCERRGG
eukprot:TRINITY_DN5091_c0_g2_i4.p1 TRINITY_DN5091_c0_g2~~TRINITY_DN5091_c0_g2_i4.p1  ORF type:complete len:251 (+),score=62.45 TRINITY_DN5091_c0_g2_i4:99-851(+)